MWKWGNAKRIYNNSLQFPLPTSRAIKILSLSIPEIFLSYCPSVRVGNFAVAAPFFLRFFFIPSSTWKTKHKLRFRPNFASILPHFAVCYNLQNSTFHYLLLRPQIPALYLKPFLALTTLQITQWAWSILVDEALRNAPGGSGIEMKLENPFLLYIRKGSKVRSLCDVTSIHKVQLQVAEERGFDGTCEHWTSNREPSWSDANVKWFSFASLLTQREHTLWAMSALDFSFLTKALSSLLWCRKKLFKDIKAPILLLHFYRKKSLNMTSLNLYTFT